MIPVVVGSSPISHPIISFQKTFNLIYLNPVETTLSYCVLMVACKMSLRHPCRYGRFSSMVNIFTCSNTSAVASKAPHCLEELVTDGRHLLHSHAQGSRQSVSTNRVGLLQPPRYTTSKLTLTSAHALNETVLPFFVAHEARVYTT